MGGSGLAETHDSVKFATFVALRSTQVVLRLSGAELAEVLGGLGDYIGEELELDSAEWLSWLRSAWFFILCLYPELILISHGIDKNLEGLDDNGEIVAKRTSQSDIKEDPTTTSVK